MVIIWILLGLVAGWYANLVAHRIPVGQSVTDPLACPTCGEKISALDSIPIISWILLGGRCRMCRNPISIRYPIVELLTAALFALLGARVGANWMLPSFLAFGFVTMTLVLTDLDWKRIPNRILFPGGLVAVLLLGVGSWLEGAVAQMPRALGGGLIHFTLMLMVAILARGGMGFGDVKLAALLGVFTAFIGWETLAVSVISGILIGGVVGLILLITRRKGRKDEVPYGPPLILGAWLAIIFPALASWLFPGVG